VLAVALLGGFMLLPSRQAAGQELENCGFESGDFDGWTALSESLEGEGETLTQSVGGYGGGGGDTWVVNDGTTLPIGSSDGGPDFDNSFTVEPFEGDFSVFTEQTGPTLNTLYQDIELPSDLESATLSWAQIIRNHAQVYEDPNQEFRVEIRDTEDNVLEVLFSTDPGDPLLSDEWEEMSADLSDYIGETIRIAFVEQDTLLWFNVHIDEACVTVEEEDEEPIRLRPTPPPHLGGALAPLIFGGTRQQPTAVAPSAVGPISPPNTGDAGLRKDGNEPLLVICAALAALATSGFILRRRLS
jgi:hypothetical protein